MGLVDRFYARLMTTVTFITAAILVALVTSVFVNVLIRYLGLLQGRMAWVDEFSRYLSIWLVFLGSAVALDKRQHVAADFLSGKVPPRAQPWLNLLVELSILLFLGVLTKEGLALAQRTTRQVSPALGWPMGAVYLAIPTGSILMIIICLRRVLTSIQTLRSGTIGSPLPRTEEA